MCTYPLLQEQLVKLLSAGKTDLLTGLQPKDPRGPPYSAYLTLDFASGRTQLMFASSPRRQKEGGDREDNASASSSRSGFANKFRRTTGSFRSKKPAKSSERDEFIH